jgi:2-phospho-L-lactate guanylyltransferase
VSRDLGSTDKRAAVVVPVKSFDLAKGRLAGILGPRERARLARHMASRVLAASGGLPAWVVCESPGVAAWAVAEDAGVIWRPRRSLSSAVAAAVEFLAAEGFDQAIVAHGDLPLATDLAWVGAFDGVTLVPDRRGDGTNVLSVPTGARFGFAYGPGSAARHRAEAERLGLALRVTEDEQLGWDVDTPEDLAVFDAAVGARPRA